MDSFFIIIIFIYHYHKKLLYTISAFISDKIEIKFNIWWKLHKQCYCFWWFVTFKQILDSIVTTYKQHHLLTKMVIQVCITKQHVITAAHCIEGIRSQDIRDAFKKKVHMEGNLPYRGGGGSTKSLVKF